MTCKKIFFNITFFVIYIVTLNNVYAQPKKNCDASDVDCQVAQGKMMFLQQQDSEFSDDTIKTKVTTRPIQPYEIPVAGIQQKQQQKQEIKPKEYISPEQTKNYPQEKDEQQEQKSIQMKKPSIYY